MKVTTSIYNPEEVVDIPVEVDYDIEQNQVVVNSVRILETDKNLIFEDLSESDMEHIVERCLEAKYEDN